MHSLALLLVTGSLVFAGCDGDSSSIMSVWNDRDAGDGVVGNPSAGGAGGQGGQGGHITIATGGSGGTFTSAQGGAGGQPSGGTIGVPGGIRDVATTQCMTTSGGSCPYSSAYLACLQGNCASNLVACYSPSATSASSGAGVCLKYANCMIGCPCDGTKTNCENACLQNYATSNPDCSMCLFNLVSCASKFNCPTTASCSIMTSGSAGGSTGGTGNTTIILP